ncbi:unnamed protein product [Penicillium discolor]
MRRRRLLTPRGTGALIAALGCVIAANILGARILLYLGVLLAALTLFAALAVRLPRRSGTVTRQISTDLLTVSETSRVTVRFTLRALRVPHGLWHDVLPSAVTGDSGGEYPADTPQLSYLVTGVRRGVWPLGPLLLRTVDPFGLAQREQAFGDTRTITVVPEVFALTPLTSSPDAVVVLDRSGSGWTASADEIDPTFEAAVSLCASAALHLAAEGYSVDVLDSAGTLLGALRGHEDDRDGLLVALAMVTPRGERRDLVALVGGTPPGPLVYVTGRLDEEDAALLRPAGAAAPLLFSTDPLPGAEETARQHGWTVARLGTDVAEAWDDALSARTGAVDRPRPAAVPADTRPRWHRDREEPAGILPLGALAALAALTALWPFTSVIEPGAWSFVVALVVVAVIGVGMLVRHLLRERPATVVGLVALLAQLLVAVGLLTLLLAGETAVAGVVPTSDTLTLFQALGAAAVQEIVFGSAPLEASPGLAAALGAGFAIVAILLDHLLAHRAAVLATVLLGAVGAVPMIVTLGPPNVAWFAVAAVVALLLFRVTARRHPGSPRRASAGVAVSVGAAAIATTLLVAPLLPVASSIAGTGVGVTTTSIRVLRMSSSWLPLPYPATDVQGLSAAWRVSPENRTLFSRRADAVGNDYTVTSVRVTPTLEQIRATEAAPPRETDEDEEVELPAIIPELAAEVTADEETDYDRLVALQNWFRSQFEYSLETPVDEGFDGTGADAVARFLEERSGYCVHFAGSFALMAESLGMQVRIVVGYLPGSRTDEKRGDESIFSVSSDQLHSWPEVLFPGIGWVPFEPTASLGVPTAFRAGATGGGSSSGPAAPAPTTAPQTEETSGPEVDRRDADAGSTDSGELRRLDPTPVLLTTLGVVISPRMRAAGLVREAGADKTALGRLVMAVERANYARASAAADDLAVPLRAVLVSLRAHVAGGTRAEALLLPRSLYAPRGSDSRLLV